MLRQRSGGHGSQVLAGVLDDPQLGRALVVLAERPHLCGHFQDAAALGVLDGHHGSEGARVGVAGLGAGHAPVAEPVARAPAVRAPVRDQGHVARELLGIDAPEGRAMDEPAVIEGVGAQDQRVALAVRLGLELDPELRRLAGPESRPLPGVRLEEGPGLGGDVPAGPSRTGQARVVPEDGPPGAVHGADQAPVLARPVVAERAGAEVHVVAADADQEAGPGVRTALLRRLDGAGVRAHPEVARLRPQVADQQVHRAHGLLRSPLDALQPSVRDAPVQQAVGVVLRSDPDAVVAQVPAALELLRAGRRRAEQQRQQRQG